MRKLLFSVAAAASLMTPAVAEHEAIAKDHAPIGVMGDHRHKKGEWMVSYRFMRMNMEGSRIGADPIAPATIATTIPNRFFGQPMQPPTLRVTPTNMTMDMHMVGAMYGVSDWLTVMAMGQLVRKEMDHVTYMGGMGTTVLGAFTTETFGVGDTKLSGLVGVFGSERGGVAHDAHLNLGLSLPTGSTTRTDQILTPMGGTPSPRLPYPMQLGSGTFDVEPGVTYNGRTAVLSWGAQYIATLRMGENDEGYALGDAHRATAWAAYGPANWLSFSTRVKFQSVGRISGIDPLIVAPVQTANPDFSGGEVLEVGVGVNLAGQRGAIKGHRVAVEFMAPVYRDLNGPQLETDWTLTVGWQKAF